MNTSQINFGKMDMLRASLFPAMLGACLMSSAAFAADTTPQPKQKLANDTGITPYGSLRMGYGTNGSESDIGNGASRAGFYGEKDTATNLKVAAKVEFGLNLVERADNSFVIDTTAPLGKVDETLFLRLSHIDFITNYGTFMIGKQWSVYYDVAKWTDKYALFGYNGSGTFNAGTDGGGSGTGRADKALSWRNTFGDVKIGVQFQPNSRVPIKEINYNYDFTLGASAQYQLAPGLELGLSYNHAKFDTLDDTLRNYGIDGDDTALLAGVNWQYEKLLLAGVLGYYQNHETTDEGTFFNGLGSELYAHYLLDKKVKAIGGYNFLKPKSGQGVGSYRVRQLLAGLQWDYGNGSFQDMLFIEGVLDGSKQANGESAKSVITVGVYFGF